MKNGTKFNRWSQFQNLEKASGVGRHWIAVFLSMRLFMWCDRVAPGGFCQGTSLPGKPYMATSADGARIGPGRSSTTRCEIGCVIPKGGTWLPLRQLLIANR